MIDPAAALPAVEFVLWRLQCIAAAQRGDPLPAMPCPYRLEVAAEDGADPYASEPLRSIIEQLEATEHAQGQD